MVQPPSRWWKKRALNFPKTFEVTNKLWFRVHLTGVIILPTQTMHYNALLEGKYIKITILAVFDPPKWVL